jgi:CubicO group peptidase (beta-lactamase class C family)
MRYGHTILPAILMGAISLVGCGETIPSDPARNAQVAGCWTGGPVRDGTVAETERELRLMSLRPDGTLALTVIHELGPRSRVWRYDFDVTCRGNDISWLAHEGTVSADGTTMHVTKNWKGEESRWMFVRAREFDGFMTRLLATEARGYDYEIPAETGDGWSCVHMESAGFNAAEMIRLMEEIRSGDHGDIHGLLICRQGRLVLEEYFALEGSLQGPFVREVFRKRVHHLASITKAVTSVLTGIALDRGLLEGVHQPVFSLFPEYAHLNTGDKSRMELRHLLTMTAGLEWEQFRYPFSDERNNAGEMYRTDDVPGYVLSRPLADPPGDEFQYSNGVATLMGEVLGRASGVDVAEFARMNLFVPLGVSDTFWSCYPDGTLDTDGGLALRPRDLARIGQLLLNDGRWADREVISPGWIEESTRRRLNFRRGRGYGYYWNEWLLDAGDTAERVIFAPGDGGQFLAVFPAREMVVVITAGNYGQDPTSTYKTLFEDYILPALPAVTGPS